ncbi:MAG: molybdenum ABC transporter ATP-binding protein [Alphaproteobacteria bacterium]|jgi:molybdate transport system ATP-binding protein|nr:molybdenum ABC transporter ATP-binding protein [Alphaproteobacteria bacterium]
MLEVALQGRQGDLAIDVAFAADRGVTALFGRSGAGKTSIVEMLAGLRAPSSGRVHLDGETLYDSEAGIDLAPERRGLGYVFQEARLFPHLTVAGNLSYGYRRTKASQRQVGFDEVVGLLELGSLLGRRPRTLSGGERQRVAIGRALLAGPRLLLMDEPLANLDQTLRQELLPFIERLGGELDIAIVYVSHSMDEILRLADTLVLVSDGRIVAVGAVEELLARLDLAPETGRWEAGAAFQAEVAAHDDGHRLTRLAFAGGTLWVGRLDLAPGARLRVRIRARDVSLSLIAPQQTSVLNVFPGTVIEIGEDEGPQVDVLIDIGDRLWARITRRSLHELGIAPGTPVHAMVKAVAIDRHSLGGRGRTAR